MCDKFRHFSHYKPVYKLKERFKTISRILCCTVHLCVFFYCTVYFHKMPGWNRIPMEHRERIVRDGETGWACISTCTSDVTVALAVSPVNRLVLRSACIGGMNAHPVLWLNGAPAHRNPAIPAANTELEMLPACSPFLNIMEQAIGSLKAAIKRDVSRPEIQARMDNRAEVRRLGIWLLEGCEPDCYPMLFSAA